MPDADAVHPLTVHEQAVLAAHHELTRRLGRLLPTGLDLACTQAALEAAEAVYEADRDAYVDRQLAETQLVGMDVDRGVRIQMVIAQELSASMVEAFRAHLGDAENYVEQTVTYRATGERYVVNIRRAAGKTPHQLQREAEAALGEAMQQLDDARQQINELQRRYVVSDQT